MPRASLIRRTYSELELKLRKQEEVAQELADTLAANQALETKESTSKEGYLYRQGSVLGWKKRFYILNGGILSRYNSKDSIVPRGSLNVIENLVVRTEPNIVKKTKEGNYLFQSSERKKEKIFWRTL